MSKKYIRILAPLIVLLIILSGVLFWAHNRESKQTAKYAAVLVKNQKMQKLIDDKQKRLNQEAEEELENSKVESVRMGAQQQIAIKTAKTDASELFNILLTYNSSKEYKARKDAAEPFLTKPLLSSKNLFMSDDDHGASMIDDFELHSKYMSDTTSVGVIENGDTVPVTVIVKYKSWFTGEKRGIGSDIYVGKFNYKDEVFTDLKRLNSLNQ